MSPDIYPGYDALVHTASGVFRLSKAHLMTRLLRRILKLTDTLNENEQFV